MKRPLKVSFFINRYILYSAIVMANPNPLQEYNERRRLEAEEKYPNDKIIELYKSGLKITEVAEIMGTVPWNKGLTGAQKSPRKGKPYPQSIGWICKDPEHPDKLYFIKLHNGNYKVGRSYKGWLYRKKETAELFGEWSGKSIDIWNLEKRVLKEFSQYKAPLNEMSMGRGMTEHFIDTLPVQEVISFIEKCSSSS
jgi:hypothetical protein